MSLPFLTIQQGHVEALAASHAGEQSYRPVHVFDQAAIDAVNAALAARRPLLVRGEPGIGKSQLARAVAKLQGWAYVQHVVDARTESRDLLWEFDAVQRLADAQVHGARGAAQPAGGLASDLSLRHYLKPGPLWWAFDWSGACEQANKVGSALPPQLDGGDPDKGCLILIDEIDKAETDVPNGLLEALGMGCFTPQGWPQPITTRQGAQSLVVITTNEERVLPDAFLRRCLVLTLPEASDALKTILAERGRAHFQEQAVTLCKLTDKHFEALLLAAAEQLVTDREAARAGNHRPLPGVAEYLDLLRAVLALAHAQQRNPLDLLAQIKPYLFEKHRGVAE